MKVDLELVKLCMQRNKIDVRKIAKTLEDVQCETVSQIDEDKPPPVRKQFVILVPERVEILRHGGLTGWVLQIPEEDSPLVVIDRLTQAAIQYNMTKKGARMPVKTIAEVCEFCPPRFLKDSKIWVKTKDSVFVIAEKNKLPLG